MSKKPDLPLVCSVSNDNWIKIYSLHERSVFRSHNVANFNLSSVDCVQIWKKKANGESAYNKNEDELNGSSVESTGSSSGGSGGQNANRKSSSSSLSSSSSQKSTPPSSPTSSLESTKFSQTLLFLSCWDNSIYIYDMNYNRCIHHAADSHDDAISRLALIKIPESRSFLLITASWDSSVKIWLTSPIMSPRSLKRNAGGGGSSGGGNLEQQLKLQFLNELSHDSAVVSFCVTRTHLATICDDGDVFLWRLNTNKSSPNSDDNNYNDTKNNTDDDEDDDPALRFKLSGNFPRLPEQPSLETTYTYQFTIEHTTETGKITDCRVIETNSSVGVSTIAVCSSTGFVKIFNLHTSAELFSIRIFVPGSNNSTPARLNRLVYTNDYIMTVDSNGYLYFVDLQQQQQQQQLSNGIASRAGSVSSSSFLSHHIKLTSHSLSSIAVYKDLIIACGDTEGYLHFVSLVDI